MHRALLLTFFLLAGCGAMGVLYHYNQYISTLIYSKLNSDDWEIMTPNENIWRSQYYKSYLQQYFPDEDKGTITWSSKDYNFFYAKYAGEPNATLALWVIVDAGLQVSKGTRVDFIDGSPIETIMDNADWCKTRKCSGIDIFTNVVDMDFNTQGVFLLKDKKVIHCDLISRNKGALCKDTVYYPHGTYNLADPRTTVLMQTRVSTGQKPLNYPCFGFKFALSCRDIENTILVISGFTYKGKPIPPLKVRLNYTDLSQVPGYEGPPATQQAQ